MAIPETSIDRQRLDARLLRGMNHMAGTFHGQNPQVSYFEMVTYDGETGEFYWAETHIDGSVPSYTQLVRHSPGYIPSVESFVDGMIPRTPGTPLVCDPFTAERLRLSPDDGSLVTTRMLERSAGKLQVHIVGSLRSAS